MRIVTFCINLYLLALLAAITTGCQTSKAKAEKMVLIQFNIEANPDASEKTQQITVNRGAPVKLTIQTEPFLDTSFLTNAVVVDTPVGFIIQLDFDKQGAWWLEATTSRYTGKRIAIQAIFPEKRWLAAPLPNRRISNGRISFTPDSTREEADRIVTGLRYTISKLKKK